VPFPREIPPEEAAYQLIVPAEAVAPNITVPASHLAAGVVLMIVGVVFTVAATEVLEPVVQPFAEAST
jgi:hypothetical protein